MTYEEARDKATETVKQHEADGQHSLSTYSYHDKTWGVYIERTDQPGSWKLAERFAH